MQTQFAPVGNTDVTTDDRRLRERVSADLQTARRDTIALFDLASEAELHKSPGFGFRPVIWHLAHIGAFESYWIAQRMMNLAPIDERYERIFDPIKTPREQSKDLPTRREMENYLRLARETTLTYLDRADFQTEDALLRNGYVFDLALEHERQHQETLAYLLHLLEPSKKRFDPATNNQSSVTTLTNAASSDEMIAFPAADFPLGATAERFAYDNEFPQHIVHVPSFKLARFPVTNERFADFIEANGYARPEFWDAEGWAWREKENVVRPLYWSRTSDKATTSAGKWSARRMFDETDLAPDHPVCGISWFEAQAYAKFAGKRLPTEAEWERAAAWNQATKAKRRYAWGDEEPDGARCNFNNDFWGTTPVNAFPSGATSPEGCFDLNGNVWEWTASTFAGYPNFTAFPYREYSEEWFDSDHRVLKGGSWATRASLLRTSFRNFFRRPFRIAFAGVRLAADE